MSTDYEPEKYLPTIDAILSVANLEEVTVKKIRNALQELFSIDLSAHKKNINEVILNRYYDLLNKREEESKQSKKRMEREDALLAAKLSRDEMNGGRRPQRLNKKSIVSKIEKPKKQVSANNPFNREMVLSSDLQSVLNAEKLSRPQVVKQLWAYIKENDLQNPKDKRQIICDDKLQTLFKKKQVDSFGMNKLLSKHIFKLEEVGDDRAPPPKHTTEDTGEVKEEVDEEVNEEGINLDDGHINESRSSSEEE